MNKEGSDPDPGKIFLIKIRQNYKDPAPAHWHKMLLSNCSLLLQISFADLFCAGYVLCEMVARGVEREQVK